MRKIVVSLSKGGVAKTTTAVHLAHGLARRGHKVLLVDTDTQGQDAVVLGVNPERGLASVVGEGGTPGDALIEARENLWLLAGGRDLAGVRKLIDLKDFGGEQTLTETLEPLEGEEVVSRFIEKRGEGFHHVCFAVPDVRAAAEDLRSKGYTPLWKEPRRGAGGRRVQFLRPRETFGLLVELSQDEPGGK